MLQYKIPILIVIIIIILTYIFCIRNENIDEEFKLFNKTKLEQIDLEIKKAVNDIVYNEAERSTELFGDEKIFNKINGRYTLEYISDRDFLVDVIVEKIHNIIADNICKGNIETEYSDNQIKKIIKRKGFIESEIITPLIETNRLTNEGFQYTTKQHISNIIYKSNNFMDILNNILMISK